MTLKVSLSPLSSLTRRPCLAVQRSIPLLSPLHQASDGNALCNNPTVFVLSQYKCTSLNCSPKYPSGPSLGAIVQCHAIGVLVLIDAKLLPADMEEQRKQLINDCRAELDKLGAGSAVAAGGMQTTEQPLPPPGGMTGEPPVSPGPARGSRRRSAPG